MVLHITMSPMVFRINTTDSAPLYRQIVRQVRDALAAGKLQAGDKLPSHRELAKDLVINHLTVKQAYDTLEADGIIHTERGRGTFVARESSAAEKRALRDDGITELEAQARELSVQAQLLGLRRADLLEIVRDTWSEAPASARRST